MGYPEFYATYGNGSTAGETVPNNVRARAPYRIRHRRVFLGLIWTILLMCLTHLALGIYISAVIDPDATYTNHGLNYTYSSGILVSRVRLAFFWVTIPCVLSILSLYEVIQVHRNRLPSLWIALSAVAAGCIWGLQLTLEGICMWTYPSTNSLTDSGLCPWFYDSSDGWNSYGLAWWMPWVIIPVICGYIVYFSVGLRAVVVDKKDAKALNAPAAPKTVDSLSLHTLSTSPVAETLATETLHPSTRGVMTPRPPSYFSDGGASADSYDVKKD